MVIFSSHKNPQYLREVSNADFQNLLRWLRSNDLIINLKPGKTETILFATAQKLKQINHLEIAGRG